MKKKSGNLINFTINLDQKPSKSNLSENEISIEKKIKKIDLTTISDFKMIWFEQCIDDCRICYEIDQEVLTQSQGEIIGQIFENYFGYKRVFRQILPAKDFDGKFDKFPRL